MTFNELDLHILRFLHIESASAGMDMVMSFVSSNWMFVILGSVMIVAFARVDKFKFWIRFLFAAGSVGMADAIAAHFMKPFFGRLRPCQVLDEVRIITGCAGQYSFPSNHAANAMCIAMVVYFMGFKRMSYAYIPLAVLIGFSRLYLGVHYFTDVIVGFLLGTLTAYIGTRAYSKFFP